MYHFCNTVYHYCHNSKAIQVVDSAAESTVGITHTLWTMSHFDKRKILASKLLYGVRVIHSSNVKETQEEWKKCKSTSCAYSANYEFHLKGVAIMKPNRPLLYFVFVVMLYALSTVSLWADHHRTKSIPKSHRGKLILKSQTEMKKDKRIGFQILSQVTKDMMGHTDPAIRSQAIMTLGRLSIANYELPQTTVFNALLHEKDEKVRRVALLVLANVNRVIGASRKLPTRGMVAIFQKIVATDRNPDFRRIAALGLLKWGQLNKNPDKIWKYTLEMLQHPDANYQMYALQKLYESTEFMIGNSAGKKPMTVYKLHPDVRKQLEEMAKTPNPSHELVRAISALWKGRPTPLDEWLEKKDYEVRQTGALALEPHALKDGGVSLDLVNTLRGDSSVKVRAAAAKALTSHPNPKARGNTILVRREFSPKMQKRVWNALIETIRHDAPEVRASAFLSLSNLKHGDANAWQIFTDAMVDKDEKVRRATVMGIGRAIYLNGNDSIQAALVCQATNVENSYRTRFRAIESLFMFNDWNSYLPHVLIELLSEPEIRLQVIELWGEYASDHQRAQLALYKTFRQPHPPPIRLALAMTLVKSGVSDNQPIKILVDEGLNDALVTRDCAELLGKSGNRESFVIQGLMEKFRASLDAVGSTELPADSILLGYHNWIGSKHDPEGGAFVYAYGTALLRLDIVTF